ncbi:nicotinate-nicotinamide nucleotide adenylyltransferase [Vibrio palustris]|uniref:nicotinate-nucleotide adenylyltransferase n=1 Tax=Vibrio palustris TaxID=1918946 RepID=A0A1R4B5B1_9VIBR|nr:nicotinate-nicotinamide nucleotide adenylyltransferase [Vibrio palustris]SJL84071.1 Nicotinate-nucleotide adenylyltransferase [Vibrio palustris]
MPKIAVFGSAFNPPSLGHKSVIERLSHFDRVLLIPSISHAWGKNMLDYSSRCELINAFIGDLGLSHVALSRIEETLLEPGQSVTTYALLSALQQQYPSDEFTFIIGPDNLFKFGQFAHADDILNQWSVMACPQTLPIRSTDIRERLSQSLPIDELTTPTVVHMLHQQQWY